MRKVYLSVFLISICFIKAQNGILIPPDNVIKTFEKQYPNKKAIWDLEYNGKNDDIIFEAKFNATANTVVLVRYDKNADFKEYKEQIVFSKLPLKAQQYLKANYSVKLYKKFFFVNDSTDRITYEARLVKDHKFYNLIFDKQGIFFKKVQIK